VCMMVFGEVVCEGVRWWSGGQGAGKRRVLFLSAGSFSAHRKPLLRKERQGSSTARVRHPTYRETGHSRKAVEDYDINRLPSQSTFSFLSFPFPPPTNCQHPITPPLRISAASTGESPFCSLSSSVFVSSSAAAGEALKALLDFSVLAHAPSSRQRLLMKAHLELPVIVHPPH
jgi:hypothetical protein